MSSDQENLTNAVIPAPKKLRSVPLQKRALPESMAWLDCGEFHLIIPSADIVTLMPLQLMTAQLISQESQSIIEAGFVDYDHHRVPVFNLSKSFQLQPQLNEQHKIIVLFKESDVYFGLVGRELTKLSDVALKVFSVPLCMSSRKQPFTEFTIHNQRAAGVSSANALLTLLRLRGVKSLTAGAGNRNLSEMKNISEFKTSGAN